MIVAPDYDVMYTHSRFHPEYQQSQNKHLTNMTSFYSHLTSSNVNDTTSDTTSSSNRTRYASEIVLNEGSMIFIPSHFYYSIIDVASSTSTSTSSTTSSTSSSARSISPTTWIAMRQSTKISYLSNKLFEAVIRDPPFLEREGHGILLSLITLSSSPLSSLLLLRYQVSITSIPSEICSCQMERKY